MNLTTSASNYLEKRMDWRVPVVNRSMSIFYLRCNTNAMLGAHIPKGSILAVDKSVTPQHGQVVVAISDGELIVRRLYKDGQRGCLQAANRRLPDVLMSEEVIIWGVVVSVVISQMR